VGGGDELPDQQRVDGPQQVGSQARGRVTAQQPVGSEGHDPEGDGVA